MLILVLMAAMSSTPPETDVLAQMQAGKVLCSNPDIATKTCSTIDTFSRSADGSIIDVGEALISPDQPITLEVASTVQIQNGTICGTLALSDLETAQVRVNGAPLPPERNAAVMNKLAEKLMPLAGRKVCEALRLQDGQLLKYGQVERVDINLPGKPVRWVMPTEGYKVAPR
jgi:hypothetical protein